MLASSSLSLTLVATLASLLAPSPASAVVTWGPTGVEYAKRFEPSGVASAGGRCWYTCQDSSYWYGTETTYPRYGSEEGAPNGNTAQTVCSYGFDSPGLWFLLLL